VPAAVEFELVKGMIDGKPPERVITNAGGLAAFAVTPIGAQQWRTTARRLRGTTDDGQAEFTQVEEKAVDSELKQYSFVFGDPVWGAGETFEVGVRTLHRSGGVYTDVYQNGRWCFGQVAGIGSEGAGFAIHESAVLRPTEGVWLTEIQTYGQSLQPADASEARFVAVPAAGMSPRDTLEVLLGRAASAGLREDAARALLVSPWLEKASDRDLYAQISFWLALLTPTTRDPHLLLDTQQGERTQLADEKEMFRSRITALLVVSGGLGLLLVLYLVVVNVIVVRKTSQRMVQELAEIELPEVDEVGEPLSDVANLARMQGIFQLVFVFATIVLFFVAIVVLLQHL
jgi:hypothetical protein